MTDEQWLRDGLSEAVPEPPPAPGRAAAAEARARRTRRRTTAGVALGVVAVVAGVAVGATTLGGTDSVNEAIVTDDIGPYDAPECPATPEPEDGVVPGPPDEPDPNAPDAVPTGATSVRLCQGIGVQFDPPDDALVTDVDGLAAVINHLERTGKPELCRADLGRGYRLSFDYPDGDRFVVSSVLYGCRVNVVGSTHRTDSEAPLQAFIELLRDQRTAASPATRPTAAELECPSYDGHSTTSRVAKPEEMVVAVFCAGQDAEPVTILPGDLNVLTADIATRSGADFDSICDAVLTAIVGRTAWDDPVVLHGECAIRSFSAGADDVAWVPSDEAEAILRSYLSQ